MWFYSYGSPQVLLGFVMLGQLGSDAGHIIKRTGLIRVMFKAFLTSVIRSLKLVIQT